MRSEVKPAQSICDQARSELFAKARLDIDQVKIDSVPVLAEEI
jgi:hypothetical protein